MKKSKWRVVFEPITAKQELYLNALLSQSRQSDITKQKLIMQAGVLPYVDFLSKYEAMCLINWLQSDSNHSVKISGIPENKVKGNGERLPSVSIMNSIRRSFDDLKWSYRQIKEYLKKNDFEFKNLTQEKAIELNRRLFGIKSGKTDKAKTHIRKIMKGN